MPNYIFLFLITFLSSNALALESVSLQLEQLEMQKWKMQGLKVSLNKLSQKNQQLSLSIKKLNLPKPFNDLNIIDVRCQQFTWGNNEIHCQQGTAAIQSKRFDSPRFKFSFLISEPKAHFNIQQLTLLKGVFNLQAEAKLEQWSIKLNGKKVALKLLQQLLLPKLKLSSGFINLDLSASGHQQNLKTIELKSQLKQLSVQTKDGTKASEALDLSIDVKLDNYKHGWHWQQNSIFTQGDLYIEPLYIENKKTDISLNSKGWFYPNTQIIEVDKARFTHPNIGFISADADINLKPFSFKRLAAYSKLINLKNAAEVYLNPYIETTAMEGVIWEGRLEAGFNMKNNKSEKGYIISDKLQLNDPKQRFDLQEATVALHWSKDKGFNKASTISWRQLDLFSIPLTRSYLSLLFKDKQISLLKAVDFPLLGGKIQVKKFDWQATEDSPKVVFSGKIKDISLEKLTKALDSKPLLGNISGDIPSVQFNKGKLSLDGGLKINLFDGEININQLALAGFGTDFSQFYSDIEITNLDLDLLTQKLEFGGMKGRLSGYVRDLYMENWKPIQFFAALETPDDDDSSHEISQKAIENIASIGGGGAVDLISRTFLGMFDNFGYDKIGLGCYLHKGVCQLWGAEAAGERGFYIVKGGGLPRIDVMGYNTRMDWAVLWERLSRISQTDEVEVE